MGLLRISIIAILVTANLVFGIPDWLNPGCSPYPVRALAYSFFHASWWHLAVNSLAVWTVYKKGKTSEAITELAVAYIIASLVYPLSFRPVIGFSNILYATLGLRTPPLSSRWWKSTPVIIFGLVTVGMAVIPSVSATTHIAAFALGVGIAGAKRLIKSLTDDARRYY